MASVRPFRFDRLPRYTREQVAVLESFAGYLSYKPYAPNFRRNLATVLETYLKNACQLTDFELRPITGAKIRELLPAPACVVVIGATPGEEKILVDLDPRMAAMAIDKLLGGSGDAANLRRPLTEIEEGVLSFLLLKLLDELHAGLTSGHELGMTLERFAGSEESLDELLTRDKTYHMLAGRFAVGKRVGYVRILIPDALVTHAFGAPVAQGGATEQELQGMRRVLESLDHPPVEARAEVATLDLGQDDIASLEPGDIIILENHRIAKNPDGIEGEVFVKLGLGRNGGLQCRLVPGFEQLRLEVLNIVLQQQPQQGAASMADAGDPGDAGAPGGADAPDSASDNLPETEGLLRDVAAPVVVELGRLQMNTAQIIRLRPGQVLRLPRGPNDPVDLVVNGKLFARAELIEVDGELGVRLIQVAGSG